MSEVYRARDTKLDREVAIKALPDEFAKDGDRIARFEREAKLLGTAAYMSPEQARGKFLDKRTDIWSFGICFYEALAGRKAFAGETGSDVIASILAKEPDWNALPSEAPPEIREVLQRCCQKDSY